MSPKYKQDAFPYYERPFEKLTPRAQRRAILREVRINFEKQRSDEWDAQVRSQVMVA